MAHDQDVILSTENDSATGHPQQFVLKHNLGDTELINRRGDLILSASANIGVGTNKPSEKLHIQNNDSLVKFGNIKTTFSSSGTSTVPDVLIKDKDNSDTRAALQVQGNNGNTEVLFAASSGKVGIGTIHPSKKLQVTGDISGSNLFAGGGNLYLQQNITADNYLKYDSTKDHIEIVSQDIYLKTNNAVGIGEGGSLATSLFKQGGTSFTIPRLLAITGSDVGEFTFTNDKLGGLSSTDQISGSTIGVISFAGRTEHSGSGYNPFGQNWDSDAQGGVTNQERTRLLAHIRGGAHVHTISYKADLDGDGTAHQTFFTKTGGFLGFHTAVDSRSYGTNSNPGQNERMRIDAFGNVGIGISDMDGKYKSKAKLVVDDLSLIHI